MVGACWLLLVITAFAQETTAGAPAKVTQDAADKVHDYEIVSIKPNKSGSDSMGAHGLPDGFELINAPLFWMVSDAYEIKIGGQVSGLPSWTRTENYDIVAKVDADTAERWKKLSRKERSTEELLMKRSILADRCQFRAHQETKDLPVYELVIAKGGLKMKEATPSEAPMEMMSDGHVTANAMTIGAIVAGFAGTDGRILVDKTGLGDKKFDFELEWTPYDRPAADDAAPSLLTAFEEQLGLKLVPAKSPMNVLIIDHMERPSPN